MTRPHRFAAWLIVWSSLTAAQAAEPEGSAAADALFRETMVLFGAVDLTPEQVGRIQGLAAKSGGEIQRAHWTGAVEKQKRAREAAISRAAANGLRGARARDAVQSELQPTEEERAAHQRATELRREFDQSVLALLTEAQRAALEQAEDSAPAVAQPAYSGYLIVQLSPRLRLPPATALTLDAAAKALGLTELSNVIAQFGLTLSRRAVEPALLDQLEQQGDAALIQEIRRLRTFWQIDARGVSWVDAQAALARLNLVPEVAHAYAALLLEEPTACSSVDPADDPYYVHQGYLSAAPEGINAPAAWRESGGQGGGVGIVDIERGWNVDHEDLDAVLKHPWHGDRMPGNDHGTSVLGEMIAEDSTKGVVGAAPCVEYVGTTSRYDAATGDSDPHIANALLAALYLMEEGDVLLIEVETSTKHPVEIELLNYLAIRVAVLSGMIVVEPAGNGDHDLDTFVWLGLTILNRGSSDFRDSGAIMVGASNPKGMHNKAGASCYGSRVDCFGWGNHVATASYSGVTDVLDNGGGDDNRAYRSKFNGTSSAAPMIASAALLVQGLWKTDVGKALSSVEMRDILSDPETGTPQGGTVPGHIGVMPDLEAIIEARDLSEGPPVTQQSVPIPSGRTVGAATGNTSNCPNRTRESR